MFQNSSPSQSSQILWVPSCNWSQKAPKLSNAGSTGRAQRNEGNEVVEVEAQPRSSAREVGPACLGWGYNHVFCLKKHLLPTINGSINKTKLWDYKIWFNQMGCRNYKVDLSTTFSSKIGDFFHHDFAEYVEARLLQHPTLRVRT